jgi:hypothetical protein
MLKNIIAPVQAWMLSQGKCAGCGKQLPVKGGSGLIKIICGCGRIYMYDPAGKKYRRANFNEIR